VVRSISLLSGVVARDRSKLRQNLINLLDNANKLRAEEADSPSVKSDCSPLLY